MESIVNKYFAINACHGFNLEMADIASSANVEPKTSYLDDCNSEFSYLKEKCDNKRDPVCAFAIEDPKTNGFQEDVEMFQSLLSYPHPEDYKSDTNVHDAVILVVSNMAVHINSILCCGIED
jgi:hypothetical protein